MDCHGSASGPSVLNKSNGRDLEKSNFNLVGQNGQFFFPLSPTSRQRPEKALTRYTTTPGNPSVASRVPAEVLVKIFWCLTAKRDLLHCTRVNRTWCECAIEPLWRKPEFFKYNTAVSVGRTLANPQQTFTYARFIRYLEFAAVSSDLNSDVLSQFSDCDNLTYLGLSNCNSIPEELLMRSFPYFRNLTTIKLTDCIQVTDTVLTRLAQTAKKLEILELDNCSKVTDEGILAVAKGCPLLCDVNLGRNPSITDLAITGLIKSCPLLTEIDLSYCTSLTDVGVRNLWRHSSCIQKIDLSHCFDLTNKAFPVPLPGFWPRARADFDSFPPSSLTSLSGATNLKPPPKLGLLGHIQELKLTRCSHITDDAIEGIVSNAPNIQLLNLTGCRLLTNRAIEAICTLGGSLQHLMVGQMSRIADSSIELLARSCTELRTINLAGS